MTDLPLRVVMVEDNPFDCELIQKELVDSGVAATFTVVADEPAFRSALKGRPHLVLADYNLPSFDLFTVLEIVQRARPDVPVIVVTGHVGDELAAECIKRGASDYVLKDRMGRLPQAVSVALQQRELKEAAKRAEGEVFASEAIKSAILDAAIDCVVGMDGNGTIIEFNAAAERAFGYSREHAVGRTVADLIVPPSYRDDHRQGFARYLETGESNVLDRRIEIEAMRCDGTLFPVELAITMATLPSGPVFTAVIRDITDRKQAEAERLELLAREQELGQRFRSILDSTVEGIYGLDADGRCTFINRAAAAMLGLSVADALGANMHDLCHHSYADGTPHAVGECPIYRAFRAGDSTTVLDDVFWRSDGTAFPVEFSSHPMDGGSTAGAVVAFKDITARKVMEKELREREALFGGAFRAARTGIALISDDAYTYVDVNDAFCEMLGYSKEELLALDWCTITHPDDREVNLRKVEGLLRGEEEVSYVTKRYVRKDGVAIWVELSDAIVRRPDGTPLYFVTHVSEITERREAERALKESQQLLDAVINNSPALIYIKDREGRYVLMNDEATKVRGLPRHDILGKTAADLFPEHVAEEIVAADEQVFERLEAIEIEEKIPGHDGGERSYLSIKFPLFDEGGDCYALCGISTDITDRANAVEERERLQAQLRQAQKMEAVGQLAGGVAHDFNNILAVILNYAEFVREDTLADDPRRADVQEIIAAGERAAALVHQLLAFSRKEIVAPKVVDLADVIDGVRELLTRTIGEDILLEIDHASADARIKADPGQLEQILLNLVVNARDAMPAGGNLTISTCTETAGPGDRAGLSPGSYVALRVSDTGSGMDAETSERIFEPFFTTKPRGEGTGLGLATVYGIVKQSDGCVYVDSEPGRGTTFVIYLPASDETPTPGTFHAPKLFDRFERASILVVEDEDAVRELVRRILERNGFEVIAVSSGDEALEHSSTRARPLDLLLTDVVMPDMSGKVLADQMNVLRPGIKTLYMSGYTDEIIAKRGVLDRGDHLITKPFNADTLLEMVQSVLSASAA